MESLIPSEIDRLVYGHVLEQPECQSAAQLFLETSPNLREYHELSKRGRRFSTTLHNGLSLSGVLDEHSDSHAFVKDKCTELGLKIPRSAVGIVDKLNYICNFLSSNRLQPPTINVTEPSPTASEYINSTLLSPSTRLNNSDTQGNEEKSLPEKLNATNDVAPAPGTECAVETPVEDTTLMKHWSIPPSTSAAGDATPTSVASTSTIAKPSCSKEVASVSDAAIAQPSGTRYESSPKRKCPGSAVKRWSGSAANTPLKQRHRSFSDDDTTSNCSLDIDFSMFNLNRALYSTQFHERLAENINKVWRPEGTGDLTTPPQDNTADGSANVELDQAIVKFIANKTESEPYFEQFIEEMMATGLTADTDEGIKTRRKETKPVQGSTTASEATSVQESRIDVTTTPGTNNPDTALSEPHGNALKSSTEPDPTITPATTNLDAVVAEPDSEGITHAASRKHPPSKFAAPTRLLRSATRVVAEPAVTSDPVTPASDPVTLMPDQVAPAADQAMPAPYPVMLMPDQVMPAPHQVTLMPNPCNQLAMANNTVNPHAAFDDNVQVIFEGDLALMNNNVAPVNVAPNKATSRIVSISVPPPVTQRYNQSTITLLQPSPMFVQSAQPQMIFNQPGMMSLSQPNMMPYAQAPHRDVDIGNIPLMYLDHLGNISYVAPVAKLAPSGPVKILPRPPPSRASISAAKKQAKAVSSNSKPVDAPVKRKYRKKRGRPPKTVLIKKKRGRPRNKPPEPVEEQLEQAPILPPIIRNPPSEINFPLPASPLPLRLKTSDNVPTSDLRGSVPVLGLPCIDTPIKINVPSPPKYVIHRTFPMKPNTVARGRKRRTIGRASVAEKIEQALLNDDSEQVDSGNFSADDVSLPVGPVTGGLELSCEEDSLSVTESTSVQTDTSEHGQVVRPTVINSNASKAVVPAAKIIGREMPKLSPVALREQHLNSSPRVNLVRIVEKPLTVPSTYVIVHDLKEATSIMKTSEAELPKSVEASGEEIKSPKTAPKRFPNNRSSLSTPRRTKPHIRALDFSTPPKYRSPKRSFTSPKRAHTSPKNILTSPKARGLRSRKIVRSTLFKSPNAGDEITTITEEDNPVAGPSSSLDIPVSKPDETSTVTDESNSLVTKTTEETPPVTETDTIKVIPKGIQACLQMSKSGQSSFQAAKSIERSPYRPSSAEKFSSPISDNSMNKSAVNDVKSTLNLSTSSTDTSLNTSSSSCSSIDMSPAGSSNSSTKEQRKPNDQSHPNLSNLSTASSNSSLHSSNASKLMNKSSNEVLKHSDISPASTPKSNAVSNYLGNTSKPGDVAEVNVMEPLRMRPPIATRGPAVPLSGAWQQATGAGLIFLENSPPPLSWDAKLRAMLPPSPQSEEKKPETPLKRKLSLSPKSSCKRVRELLEEIPSPRKDTPMKTYLSPKRKMEVLNKSKIEESGKNIVSKKGDVDLQKKTPEKDVLNDQRVEVKVQSEVKKGRVLKPSPVKVDLMMTKKIDSPTKRSERLLRQSCSNTPQESSDKDEDKQTDTAVRDKEKIVQSPTKLRGLRRTLVPVGGNDTELSIAVSMKTPRKQASVMPETPITMLMRSMHNVPTPVSLIPATPCQAPVTPLNHPSPAYSSSSAGSAYYKPDEQPDLVVSNPSPGSILSKPAEGKAASSIASVAQKTVANATAKETLKTAVEAQRSVKGNPVAKKVDHVNSKIELRKRRESTNTTTESSRVQERRTSMDNLKLNTNKTEVMEPKGNKRVLMKEKTQFSSKGRICDASDKKVVSTKESSKLTTKQKQVNTINSKTRATNHKQPINSTPSKKVREYQTKDDLIHMVLEAKKRQINLSEDESDSDSSIGSLSSDLSISSKSDSDSDFLSETVVPKYPPKPMPVAVSTPKKNNSTTTKAKPASNQNSQLKVYPTPLKVSSATPIKQHLQSKTMSPEMARMTPLKKSPAKSPKHTLPGKPVRQRQSVVQSSALEALEEKRRRMMAKLKSPEAPKLRSKLSSLDKSESANNPISKKTAAKSTEVAEKVLDKSRAPKIQVVDSKEISRSVQKTIVRVEKSPEPPKLRSKLSSLDKPESANNPIVKKTVAKSTEVAEKMSDKSRAPRVQVVESKEISRSVQKPIVRVEKSPEPPKLRSKLSSFDKSESDPIAKKKSISKNTEDPLSLSNCEVVETCKSDQSKISLIETNSSSNIENNTNKSIPVLTNVEVDCPNTSDSLRRSPFSPKKPLALIAEQLMQQRMSGELKCARNLTSLDQQTSKQIRLSEVVLEQVVLSSEQNSSGVVVKESSRVVTRSKQSCQTETMETRSNRIFMSASSEVELEENRRLADVKLIKDILEGKSVQNKSETMKCNQNKLDTVRNHNINHLEEKREDTNITENKKKTEIEEFRALEEKVRLITEPETKQTNQLISSTIQSIQPEVQSSSSSQTSNRQLNSVKEQNEPKVISKPLTNFQGILNVSSNVITKKPNNTEESASAINKSHANLIKSSRFLDLFGSESMSPMKMQEPIVERPNSSCSDITRDSGDLCLRLSSSEDEAEPRASEVIEPVITTQMFGLNKLEMTIVYTSEGPTASSQPAPTDLASYSFQCINETDEGEEEVSTVSVTKFETVFECAPKKPRRGVSSPSYDSLMNYAIVGSPRDIQRKKRKGSKEILIEQPEKKTCVEDPQALLKKVGLDRFLSAVHGEERS